jgi:glutamine synthetase
MNVSPPLPITNAQSLIDELQQRGVSTCFVQWIKPSGELVGCWVPLTHLASAIADGVYIEKSMLAKYSGETEVKTLRADITSSRVFGCLDGYAHLVADSWDKIEPNKECGRLALKSYLNRLKRGFPDLNIHVERRATVFFRATEMQTNGTSRLYNTSAANDYLPLFRARDFLSRLHEWLVFVGFDVSQIEHCAGGLFIIQYLGNDVLEAADNWVRFRLLANHIADDLNVECETGIGHSLDLSPSPITLSIRSADNTPLLTYKDELTTKGQSFVAGIIEKVEHLAEIQHIALGSFKRQFPLFQVTAQGLQWNMINGSANPYWVLLEILQAGIEGIEQNKALNLE